MNRHQARILIANANAIAILPYQDPDGNPIKTFILEATECLGEISRVAFDLVGEEPALGMALRVVLRNLGEVIRSLPTYDFHRSSQSLPEIRRTACEAVKELAKVIDD